MGADAFKFPFQGTQAQLLAFSIQIGGIRVIQCLQHAFNSALAQCGGIKLVLVHIFVEDDIPGLPHTLQSFPLAWGSSATQVIAKTKRQDKDGYQ